MTSGRVANLADVRVWALSKCDLLQRMALFALLVLATTAGSNIASAQPTGIVADGNAVVTGFSGAPPPTLIAPGVDPADKTTIDLNGPSARVIDLQAPGAPPQGQSIQATKPFTMTAGQIGQVFAVTLDNATPPNIYLAATSVYGLPIVVPDAGGVANRAHQGAPNARFMAGLFGPEAQQGGPGSIWRIDGASGAVRLFANVALDGVPNSGPALGGLAFDPASNSFFVADRATGMIHRFDPSGADRGRYDHGTQGRQAGGLPPVPFDPATRLNITSPSFRPDNPETWGYAPPARRIFGLAVREGRLYYAVAENLQIWSVSISPDGAFGADARVEFTVPPGQGASEISKIAFSQDGRMLLAERVAPSGAFDFAALTREGGGRLLSYPMAPPGGAAPSPNEYAIGFSGRMTNSNGGLAIGYGYDGAGNLDRNACGRFVWTSGEQLRVTTDAALAAQLAQQGPPNVNGLQGNPIELFLPANSPPRQSFFVDYDDRFEDTNARGQVGDVAINSACAREGGPPPGAPPGEPGMPPGPPPGGPPYPPEPLPPQDGGFGPGPDLIVELWPDWPPPPPPVCPPGTHPEPNGLQCCPPGQIPGVGGVCQSPCPSGSMAPADVAACLRGFLPPGPGVPPANPGTCWNGTPPVKVAGCLPNNYACNKCPKPPLKHCPSGMNEVAGGPPAAGWMWSNVHCEPNGPPCPPGQQRNMAGVCQALCPGGQTAFPVNRCCVNGTHVNALGQCPGVIVPPDWYLDFLATGTGPCLLPDGNCSYFEFTITGRQRFGRGSLTQRITLPPGSAFPEARIIRGSKYCPASNWSCSKSGDVITCSAEDCGLEPGDQVVLRTEGRVVPHLTQPPPQPIDQTACGVLEWEAVPGRGPITPVQPGEALGGAPPPQITRDGAPTEQRGVKPSRQACWTIRVLPRQPPPPPACPPNYVATDSGQCCLARQMTATGMCCPAGQRPDARRQGCVGVTPLVPVLPPVVVPPPDRCPPGTVRLRSRECCPRQQVTVDGRCCPPGQTPDARRRKCVGPPVQPVPGITVVPVVPEIERPCPPGTHRLGRRCVPQEIERPCPPGTHRLGRRCVPQQIERPCPPGTYRMGRRCVPQQIERPCPPGSHRVGRRCVPSRLDQGRPAPSRGDYVRPRPRNETLRARPRPVRPGPY